MNEKKYKDFKLSRKMITFSKNINIRVIKSVWKKVTQSKLDFVNKYRVFGFETPSQKGVDQLTLSDCSQKVFLNL